jgi:hypothetical protein
MWLCTDTKEERNVLMQNVYPKLAAYCREKYGLEFQVGASTSHFMAATCHLQNECCGVL